MRILLAVILIPVFLYGSLIGYLHYTIGSKADDLVRSAAPFARISYDSVYTSLLGDEIGLDNITITPEHGQSPFRIAQLRLSAPHMGYFIDAENSFAQGQLPDHLGLELKRLQFNLSNPLFDMLEMMQQQYTAQQKDDTTTLLSRIDAIGCGDLDMLAISDYRRMGIEQVSTDIAMNLDHDEQRGLTRVDMQLRADNLYEVEMAVEANQTAATLRSAPSTDGLQKVSLNYRDTGLHSLRNDYCAELNGESAEEYVARHLQLAGRLLKASLPQQTQETYRDYLLNGGSVAISIEPSDEMDPQTLQYYKAEDVLAMLGLSISINGIPVDTGAIVWNEATQPPPELADNEVAPAPQSRPEPALVAPLITASETPAPGYKVIAVEEADEHLHKMAEVTTVGGRVRRGTLENVADERIYLVTRLSAGTMTYPVEFKNIDKLRVWY